MPKKHPRNLSKPKDYMNNAMNRLSFEVVTLGELALALSDAADATATARDEGVQLAQQGAFDEAIEEFTKAIEIDPEDVRIYRDRGGVYLTTKRFQEAANISKAIELSPKDYAGYRPGAGQSELLQLDQALADLNKAIELNPNDPETRSVAAWFIIGRKIIRSPWTIITTPSARMRTARWD